MSRLSAGRGRSSAGAAGTRDLGFIRSVRAREGADLSKAFALALFVLFIVFLLVAIAVGTRIYGGLAQNQSQLGDQRLATTLIANDLRANDAWGSVRVAEGPEGPALELSQTYETGGYVTRIYQSEGKILQEYALADSPYDPLNAVELVASERFDVDVDEDLVTVSTDEGTVKMCLRSAQGNA